MNSYRAAPTPIATCRPWPLPVRVLFRFSFLYWALWLLPTAGQATLLDLPPWDTTRTTAWFRWPLARLTHIVGVHVFHLQGLGADWHPTGSGDTAMNYVQVALTLVLAVAGAVVWTVFDEARLRRDGAPREYRTTYAWLRLLLRFTLAVTLLNYGFAKIFPGQFGAAPRLSERNETYGESSPMHVLWFLMTVSRPYTIFGGFMEALPGLLLLFRRTSTLGLLGAIAVMSNAVAMNFCYDVTVKLYSTHLLLLSLFLLLPDLVPMWRFFVRRSDAVLTGVWVRPFERKPLRVAAHVLQGLVILGAVWGAVQEYKSRDVVREPSPLRGMWSLDAVKGWPQDDGQPKLLVLDNISGMRLLTDAGKRISYDVTYDAKHHKLTLPKMDAPTALEWQSTDARNARLSGVWMGKPVQVTMHRTDPDTYPLLTRGFHWVQEMPFNR